MRHGLARKGRKKNGKAMETKGKCGDEAERFDLMKAGQKQDRIV